MITNVLSYLDNAVSARPEKTAYSDGEDDFTFERVYKQSRAIGSFLCGEGIYREPVAVFTKRHPRAVVAFLGVIAGGCFYVPLDEKMPDARMEMILDNCRPRLMICDGYTEQRAKELALNLKFDCDVRLYDDLTATCEDARKLADVRAAALDVDPVYVVYTSGSTGTPKGVAASHRSVIDYTEQLSDALSFGEDTVFGNQAPLYMDACLKDIFPTLKFAATAYIIPSKLFMFPVKLVEYLNEHRINTLCWVVSALTMISAFGTFDTIKPLYLRTVAFGGEVFPLKQFRVWRKALPEVSFTNLYGPTEGTGMCCFYHVTRDINDGESIPIGRPFANTEVLLLDENDRLSDEGELCIRGASVTLGYYNDPVRTAAAYVQNPLNTAYPEIIYRTGDIVRRDKSGDLIFVSRKDYQIKHMGHRVELGEIEADAMMTDGVGIASCVYDESRDKIVMFYTGDIGSGELLCKLKEKLPQYMVPSRVTPIDKFPLTQSGKIDRIALKNLL